VGSVVVASGLYSTGSIVAANKLSSMACGIFQDEGSNLCLLHWQKDFLPLSHQGSPIMVLKKTIYETDIRSFRKWSHHEQYIYWGKDGDRYLLTSQAP